MRIVSQAQSNSTSFPSSAVSACAVGSISPPNYPAMVRATEDYTIMITGSTFLWSNGATTTNNRCTSWHLLMYSHK